MQVQQTHNDHYHRLLFNTFLFQVNYCHLLSKFVKLDMFIASNLKTLIWFNGTNL